jgi:hypothetical protein
VLDGILYTLDLFLEQLMLMVLEYAHPYLEFSDKLRVLIHHELCPLHLILCLMNNFFEVSELHMLRAGELMYLL